MGRVILTVYITCAIAFSLLFAHESNATDRYSVLEVYKTLRSNFTYQHEEVDSWDVYPVDTPFRGDCEDFAFSLQEAVGVGKVYLVERNGVVDHAVYVYDKLIWDNGGVVYFPEQYTAMGYKVRYDVGEVYPFMR